jgi:hypothetical protein
MTPLAQLDSYFAPIIISANIARQARDNLPQPLWMLVPEKLRVAIDNIFLAVENYDRMVGKMQQLGVMAAYKESEDGRS